MTRERYTGLERRRDSCDVKRVRGWIAIALVAACGSKKDKRSEPPPIVEPTLPSGPVIEPGPPPAVLDLAKGARGVIGGNGPRHAADGVMVAFSSDGRKLASIDSAGDVFVWDTATGAPIERVKVNAYRSFVGFRGDKLSITAPEQFAMTPVSDDGGWLFTNTELFEIATGNVVPYALENPYGVSIRGTTIAIVAADHTVTVGSFTGPRTTVAAAEEKAYSALLSPDGAQLAVFLENKTIRLHPVAGGAPRVLSMESVNESNDGATNAAWSPDGNWLAVALNGTQLGLVDVRRGQYSELARDSFANNFEDIVWSPNGRAVAAITKYGRVRLFDARTGKLVHVHDGVTGTVWDVAVTADGSTLASAGDENGYLWKLAGATATEQKLGDHEHWVTHVALADDGKLVASCSDYGDINFRRASSGGSLGKVKTASGDCEALAFRNNKLLAFDGNNLVVFPLVDTKEPAPIPLAAGRKYGSAVFAASHDGAFVASGGDDGQIALHKIAGPLVWKFTMPDDPDEEGQRFEPHALAFDATGKWLASAGGDETIRIHDTRTGRVARTIKLEVDTPGWPAAIAWSGSRVVVGRSTGEIQAFDTAGKRVLDARHRLGGVHSLAATASQIYAGGGDGSITIWDLP